MVPFWKETPHGARATVVALPGPPTPPATVVMVPGAGAARAPLGAAAAPAPLASAVPTASAAAAPVNRIRADMVRLPITSGLIRYLLRICVPGYRGAPAGDTPPSSGGPFSMTRQEQSRTTPKPDSGNETHRQTPLPRSKRQADSRCPVPIARGREPRHALPGGCAPARAG